MSQPLVVHVNRGDHYSLEPEAAGFEAGGSFLLRLENHGAGCHLHLTFHGDLVPGAGLEDDNPYLEEEGELEVPVHVAGDVRSARGSIEIVTGYGQVSTTVEVEVTDGGSGASGDPVGADVAASATEPTARPPQSGPAPSPDDPTRGGVDLPTATELRALAPEFTVATALVGALALLAVIIAVGALQVLDGLAVTIGVLAVVATVVGSGLYLLTQ